jgi:hypothetical protein
MKEVVEKLEEDILESRTRYVFPFSLSRFLVGLCAYRYILRLL